MIRLDRETTYHKASVTPATCNEEDGNKCDVKDIKNEEKSAKIQMYKPTLMNFCPGFNFFSTTHWEL